MKHKSIIISLIALLLLLSFGTQAEEDVFVTGGVYISEVSATGEDWIELCNGGTEPVDLKDWVLADTKNPEKISRGHGLTLSGTLKPKAYALYKELPFGISADGEKIYLFNPYGEIMDSFETGVQKAGISSGRLPDRPDERLFFEPPTPGEANGAGYAGFAPEPMIADRDLYRTEPFQLSIACGESEVRYTLDCSEPDRNSTLYSGPIEIKKNTVVRARAYKEGCLPSELVTVTYLFEKQHTVPVVTFAIEPADWEKLRVAKKDPIEVEGSVCYYEKDGSFGISFPAGLTVRGHASRKNVHKSFGVHLRSKYGAKNVTYPFWGEGTALPYANLTLRSGSQDMYKARMRDSFCVRASANLRVDKIQTRLTVLYVNGEYYGVADLNEGMNQKYVETHYGIDGDKVNIVDRNDIVAHGSGDGLLALREFVKKNDLAKDEVFEKYRTMVDIDAFTDYLIAETFFCNGDFHNTKYWGTDDGTFPYRPVLYDLDVTLLDGNSHYNNVSKFFTEKGFKYGQFNYYVDSGLFGMLKRNAGWRQEFLDRYAYLLCNDFSVETLETLFDQMVAELEPEMPRNIDKWREIKSVAAWKKQVDILRKQIRLRYDKIQGILIKEFNISKAEWAALMEKYGGKAA